MGHLRREKQIIFEIIFVLSITVTISWFFLGNLIISRDDLLHESSFPIVENNSERILLRDWTNFRYFKVESFQKPNILFIVGDPYSLDSDSDLPFYDFMTSTLSYLVTIHDDNNSYNFNDYDAIVISESIAESGTVTSLKEAKIPILTMEAWNYQDFKLGSGCGQRDNRSIEILNNTHYITLGFPLGDLVVYPPSYSISYLTGYSVGLDHDIVSLAQQNSRQPDERTLITLDRGKRTWDNSLAPERRSFWGITNGFRLISEGWTLWNKTLHWILYDDLWFNATLNINIKDLDNKNVPNAQVNLTDSWNASKCCSQNTTINGNVTFTNISSSHYNITVMFENAINDSLTFLEISREYTYDITPQFEYSIVIPKYLDKTPPMVQNVYYKNVTRPTFFADVFDESVLSAIFLNLTIVYLVDPVEVVNPPKNFTMVKQQGNTYFNDTALNSLAHEEVRIFYNIIAIDIANNVNFTAVKSFKLGDSDSSVTYEPIDLSALLEIGLISISLFFLAVFARQIYRSRILHKKEREKDILRLFSDILSIRAIICRNENGLAFYRENFLYENHDLDLTAGITSALSHLISELSPKNLEKGEFDIMEREGFGILSHHGQYSTISIVSEQKLSEYMRKKISILHDLIEERFTKQDIENLNIVDRSNEVKELVYEYLTVGLLQKLIFSFKTFSTLKNQFPKPFRKWSDYIRNVDSLTDGQLVFHLTTFTSSLAVQGIPLTQIYAFIEKCYKLGVIRSLSDDEIDFFKFVEHTSVN